MKICPVDVYELQDVCLRKHDFGERKKQYDCFRPCPIQAFGKKPRDKQHPAQDMHIFLCVLSVGRYKEDAV